VFALGAELLRTMPNALASIGPLLSFYAHFADLSLQILVADNFRPLGAPKSYPQRRLGFVSAAEAQSPK